MLKDHKDNQELYCHGCNRFVKFILDFEKDGNYQIDCPNCGHSHYRVIRNGRITDERYRSSMQYTMVYSATSAATSTLSYYQSTRGSFLWSTTAT